MHRLCVIAWIVRGAYNTTHRPRVPRVAVHAAESNCFVTSLSCRDNRNAIEVLVRLLAYLSNIHLDDLLRRRLLERDEVVRR